MFFTPESLWYDRSRVKSLNLPSASFTSLGFVRFALIQDMVWVDFSVSDLKINYMGTGRIKLIKTPLRYIGDRADFGSVTGKEFFRIC